MPTFKPGLNVEFDAESTLNRTLARNAETISNAYKVATRPHRAASEVAARISADNEKRREQTRRALINSSYSPLIRLQAQLDQDANFQRQWQRMVEGKFPTLRVWDNFISTEPEIRNRALESMKTVSSAYIQAASVDSDRLQNSIAGLYSSILRNGPYGSMASGVLQEIARFPMGNVDIAGLQRSMTNLAKIVKRAQASHYLPRDWTEVRLGQSFAGMIPETATWPSAENTTDELFLPSLEDLTDQIGALTVALIFWVRNGGSVITAQKLFRAIFMTYMVYMSLAEGVNTTVEFMENLQHFYELLRDE